MDIISLVLHQSQPILRHLSSLYLVIAKDKAVLFLWFIKINIQTHRKIGGVVKFCPSSVIFLVRRVSWSVFLYSLKTCETSCTELSECLSSVLPVFSSFTKGVIQDVKIIFIPNGYITQCPNLNRSK